MILSVNFYTNQIIRCQVIVLQRKHGNTPNYYFSKHLISQVSGRFIPKCTARSRASRAVHQPEAITSFWQPEGTALGAENLTRETQNWNFHQKSSTVIPFINRRWRWAQFASSGHTATTVYHLPLSRSV